MRQICLDLAGQSLGFFRVVNKERRHLLETLDRRTIFRCQVFTENLGVRIAGINPGDLEEAEGIVNGTNDLARFRVNDFFTRSNNRQDIADIQVVAIIEINDVLVVDRHDHDAAEHREIGGNVFR